jgi:hypothetical protein
VREREVEACSVALLDVAETAWCWRLGFGVGHVGFVLGVGVHDSLGCTVGFVLGVGVHHSLGCTVGFVFGVGVHDSRLEVGVGLEVVVEAEV